MGNKMKVKCSSEKREKQEREEAEIKDPGSQTSTQDIHSASVFPLAPLILYLCWFSPISFGCTLDGVAVTRNR